MRPDRLAGPAGAAVALGGVAAAIVRSPTFSWTTSALSDLGTAAETALLFNGGLVAGGVIALGYAAALRRQSISVAVGYALSIAAMIFVGVFPSGTAPHFPVAVAFFLFSTATVALDGWQRRTVLVGRLAIAGAAVHLLGWVLWGVGIRPGPGLALPELGGVALFAGWVLFFAPPVST
ncbi:DUF998 domain-containing protein [Halobellus marinus]|uniref:DUF998 domain-containing protein n=1 Tax=Halobellus TaxID=1073986 RepID=UPI0028A796E3|nr:DUF998 domain-containing protein [Halobellus sp. DFY28]